MNYKLGSLFDGSGGFPLAGTLCGIEPVWAAEVEPYPIAVTRERFNGNPENPLRKLLSKHFPNMKLLMAHLGDISKVSGAEIEPVDIITFGSPCQDLSVAGKRAGLKHEANGDEETTRSGLFMEAVRIIKEMRQATNGQYPRFALWENVPGAFSSNKGEDFRIVCEELIKIVEPDAFMPPVPQKGWNYSDCYIGDGWSLAYRVLDAQYWGVPQRRRRIYLVADFRGERAKAVLFEREGLRGYFAEGRTPWQTTPADAKRSLGANDPAGESDPTPSGNLVAADTRGGDRGLDAVVQPVDPTFIIDNVGGQAEYAKASAVNGTLRAGAQGLVAYAVENHPADSRVNLDESGKVQTLTSRMGTGGGNVPMVMEPFCKSARGKFKGDAETWKGATVANTLNTFDQGEARANELVVTTDPNFIDVEMEVAVRKYEIDTTLLSECLRCHKVASGFSNREIAERLGLPVTLVEHWFRADNGFAIPDPNVWHALKELLGIKTTEFDQSVTEFEFKAGNYDMRNRIHTGDVSPTLTCGSGNALHLLPSDPVVCMATQQGGAEIRTDNKAPTLTAAAGMSGNNQPVICLQGNGIDRADTAGCNGKGWKEDTSYTLNTIDRPAVVYAVDQGGGKSSANVTEDKAPTLCTTHGGEPAVAYGLDRASFNQGQNAKFDFSVMEGQQPTLTARGPGAVCTVGLNNAQVAPTLISRMSSAVRTTQDNLIVTEKRKGPNYIVRRLTPTECARLQGFADQWGHVPKKDNLTDEEYRFWLEVRNTHAVINGRKVQEYTAKQMLTWYNKLWTDSAEYKMWGNGIALPTALYCLQGVLDALTTEGDLDDWMN